MENYKCSLENMCERFKGQPIEALTSDGVRYCGIVLTNCCDGVEIIDKCNRIIFIAFRHIDAIVEPKMKLTAFCERSNCKCCDGDCDECGGHNHKEDKKFKDYDD